MEVQEQLTEEQTKSAVIEADDEPFDMADILYKEWLEERYAFKDRKRRSSRTFREGFQW